MNNIAGWDHRRIGTRVAIGVVGASVAMGVAACSGGSSNPSVTPTTTALPTATTPAQAGHAHGLIGQITAENGTTWTVNARNGTQYTVRLMQNPNYSQSGVSQGSLSRKLATRRMK
jgi:hypothetical protein